MALAPCALTDNLFGEDFCLRASPCPPWFHIKIFMRRTISAFTNICGLRYQVRTWGDARAPKLFMLHGWMDVSASFQFVVDELRHDWHVIAPDWRGFGLSEWTRAGYWFPDYIADLDLLLEHFQ